MKGTAQLERAHFKKCVVPVTIQHSVWIGKKRQSWRLMVLRPFFFFKKKKKCFHSGVVGTNCHVVLGRHLFLCHFKV